MMDRICFTIVILDAMLADPEEEEEEDEESSDGSPSAPFNRHCQGGFGLTT